MSYQNQHHLYPSSNHGQTRPQSTYYPAQPSRAQPHTLSQGYTSMAQPMSHSRSQDSIGSSSSSSDSPAPYQYPSSNQGSQQIRYAPYDHGQGPSQPRLAPPPLSTNTRGSSSRAPTSPTSSTGSKPHICLHPNCTGAFARYYDLQRHMKIHFPSPSARLDCPYARPGGTCGRAGEKTPNCKGGFTREDHFVDHLRTVHGVEIPKGRGRRRSGEEWAVRG